MAGVVTPGLLLPVRNIPYRMEMYIDFNLAAWLRTVKFTDPITCINEF